jgi:integrase
LTVEETKKLLQRAVETKDDDMMLYLAIGAFAGLRVAEIERLDWREIDLRGKLIEVTAAKAKTRQRRHVTIAANLAEWLRLVPADRRTGQVIKGQVRVDRFAERAGVTEWPKNALRHSFVSFHLARHRDAAVTAGQAGHDQNMLFANYRELVKPGPATAYWKIRPSS